ncbi:hypothetical protein B0H14DRAFT_2572149 [Mycena olivaceomarginata]|nr:hypothetical protein B0H14DRAFT_2572149 [Mycena olivaceomarginata]
MRYIYPSSTGIPKLGSRGDDIVDNSQPYLAEGIQVPLSQAFFKGAPSTASKYSDLFPTNEESGNKELPAPMVALAATALSGGVRYPHAPARQAAEVKFNSPYRPLHRDGVNLSAYSNTSQQIPMEDFPDGTTGSSGCRRRFPAVQSAFRVAFRCPGMKKKRMLTTQQSARYERLRRRGRQFGGTRAEAVPVTSSRTKTGLSVDTPASLWSILVTVEWRGKRLWRNEDANSKSEGTVLLGIALAIQVRWVWSFGLGLWSFPTTELQAIESARVNSHP